MEMTDDAKPGVEGERGAASEAARASAPETESGRAVRADARRNRARVLDAAIAAFAEEGLAVPVHEIARRAGVGTGTVSRHFPTKESLFEAIVLERVGRLLDQAHELAATAEPGPAFFGFFAAWVREGALNRGLSQALAGDGYDMEAAALRAGLDFGGTLSDLLAAAQAARAVQDDIELGDIKALMAGCLARSEADGPARERVIRVVSDGLQPKAQLGAQPAANPVSESQNPVIRTYLEMSAREQLRPGREVRGLEFVRLLENPDAIKVLHDEVAGPYGWSSLPWTADKWREQMAKPDQGIFVLRIDGTNAGFLFLAVRENRVVEICLFGLRPEYVGRGIGAQALTLACHAAWDFQPPGYESAVKIVLDTCTHDHPRSLANYLDRGFVATRVEVERK